MSGKASETDWRRIGTMPDEDIDLSDIPEIIEKQMAKAKVRIGGRPVPEGNAGTGIGMLVDADIVAYFKTKAGEKNYESVTNKMLKSGYS